ncbi:hypothetical protein VTO73DRAFT_9796 [Trametes versicolor]
MRESGGRICIVLGFQTNGRSTAHAQGSQFPYDPRPRKVALRLHLITDALPTQGVVLFHLCAVHVFVFRLAIRDRHSSKTPSH